MATRFNSDGRRLTPTKRSAGVHRFGALVSDENLQVGVSSTVAATASTPADITAKEGLVVISSSNNAYMVRLPARPAGTVLNVYNSGGSSALIRPPLGGKFNGGSDNLGITVVTRTLTTFHYITPTHVAYDTGVTPTLET